MKFSILLASMAALVSADVCDPKVMTTDFYNDAECKDKNEELTKQYHTVKESDYKYYTEGCHPYQNLGYTLSCDAKGTHQFVYKDHECKEPETKIYGGKVEYEFDKCEKAKGANLWIKIHTTQQFKE